MSMKKKKSDFNAMNVVEVKIYLQERGVSVVEIFKNLASGNPLCRSKVDPNFEKDHTNDADNLNNS